MEPNNPNLTHLSPLPDQTSTPPSRPARLRGGAARFYERWLGLRGAGDEERELIRKPAAAAFRRIRSWFVPILVVLIAAGVLASMWMGTSSPWRRMGFLFSRILLLEAVIGLPAMAAADFTARRRHSDPAFLQELYLTGLAPRTVALSSVSAMVAVWATCVALLAPLEIYLIFDRLNLYRLGQLRETSLSAFWWVAIRDGVVAVAAGCLFTWFHIETVRFAAWNATVRLLPRLKKSTPETRRDPLQSGSLVVFYVVLLVFFSLPLLLMGFALIFLGARLFGMEILLSDLYHLPEVQLIAWFGVGGFFVFLKRRLSEASLEQFARRWLPMVWRGVAEPDGPSPPQLRLGLAAWFAYYRARARVEAGGKGGRFARWRARLARARYRWLLAHRIDLDPESHRTTGWGRFRGMFAKSGEEGPLRIPDVPLPYDPNPNRVLGTPIGGPERLESPAGSFVCRVEPPKHKKLKRIVLGILYNLWESVNLLALIVLFLLVAFVVALGVETAFPWRGLNRELAVIVGVFFLLLSGLLLFVIGFRASLGWVVARFQRYRTNPLVKPGSGCVMVPIEDARSFHLSKVIAEDFAFLRTSPEGLEMEGLTFRARLRPQDIRFQVHESPLGHALLLTVVFGDVLWGVTLCGNTMIDTTLIPFVRDWRIRAFRNRIVRSLSPPPAELEGAPAPPANEN